MKLTELDPWFFGAGGHGIMNKDGTPVPERKGVGLGFKCPCGCESMCAVHFANPLDGGPATGVPQWRRTGETFENITLEPSIQRVKVNGQGCGWHGWIRNGEIVNA